MATFKPSGSAGSVPPAPDEAAPDGPAISAMPTRTSAIGHANLKAREDHVRISISTLSPAIAATRTAPPSDRAIVTFLTSIALNPTEVKTHHGLHRRGPASRRRNGQTMKFTVCRGFSFGLGPDTKDRSAA